MSILDSLFDVVRGFPQEGVIDESYAPLGAYVPKEGEVVTVENDSGSPAIAAATATRLDTLGTLAALLTAMTDFPHLWMVVSGMEAGKDYDGIQTGKAVCLLGTFMVRTERYASGDTFTVGAPVTVETGIIRSNPFSAQEHQKYGEVIEVDAANSTLVLAVHSGTM